MYLDVRHFMCFKLFMVGIINYVNILVSSFLLFNTFNITCFVFVYVPMCNFTVSVSLYEFRQITMITATWYDWAA